MHGVFNATFRVVLISIGIMMWYGWGNVLISQVWLKAARAYSLFSVSIK